MKENYYYFILLVGIEHHPKLVEFAIGNIKSDDSSLLESGKVIIIQGDGRLGDENHAPYDAIHVGAAAPEIPQCLLDQLKIGGRMICPVGPAGETQQLEQVSYLLIIFLNIFFNDYFFSLTNYRMAKLKEQL